MNTGTLKKSRSLRTATKNNSYYVLLLIALAAVCAIMAVVNSNFLTLTNVVSMLEQMPDYALMALGIMLCIVAGGIDLSTVGVANLVAALSALALLRFVPEETTGVAFFFGVAVILIGAVLVGALCGLLNGLLITKLGIPQMLATMGSNYLYIGICMVLTKGASISGINTRFVQIMSHKILNVLPVSILVLFACTILVGILMNRAAFGTKLCMIGTNPKATRMAGINNDRIVIAVHVICATLSAIAGMIMLGRLSSARADYGRAYSTQAILIVILGGTDPLGGSGKVLGVLLGSLIIQAVTTAIAMIPNSNSYIKNVVFAALLLGLMIFDWYRANRKR